jgi:chemotaxis signal transduction protein
MTTAYKSDPPSESSLKSLAERIHEITLLEDKLIRLKQDFLLNSASNTQKKSDRYDFLLFKVQNHKMAAPLKHIEEVVEMPELIPLPNNVTAIKGLVNYHGKHLPVIDIATIAGAPCQPVSTNNNLIICSIESRQFALKIDEALEVITVNREKIEISDELLPGILPNAGILNLDNQIALIIDIGWIAIGAQLAEFVSADGAKPVKKPDKK